MAGGQYQAAARLLRVMTGMEVQVSLGGTSQSVFGTDQLMSPDGAPFQVLWQSALLNYSTVAKYLGPYTPRTRCAARK